MTTPEIPLTDAELDEIAARADAAAPGPWEWDASFDAAGLHLGELQTTQAQLNGEDPVLYFWQPAGGRMWFHVEPADAAFIAHARTDIPRLAAEVRRLRGLEDFLRPMLHVDDGQPVTIDDLGEITHWKVLYDEMP